MPKRAKKDAENAFTPAESYRWALRLINDRDTLLEVADQMASDRRLHPTDRESLMTFWETRMVSTHP